MAELTYEKFLTALVVILLIAGAYNTIMTAWKNYREEKRLRDSPVTKLTERVDRHDELLANNKKRMDEMDERLSAIRKESSMTLRGVRALLSHEINGNSNEKLQKSYDEIDEYLLPKE